MSFKIMKKTFAFGLFLSLTACSSLQSGNSENSEVKEKFYLSMQNHTALISLYRDTLKNNDSPETRYKLSNSYYKSGDSKSSLLYLEPLLSQPNNEIREKALLLKVRNHIQLKQYNEAMSDVNMLIQQSPSNGEAYNLRGIVFAQKGKLQDAFEDITKARELFITDLVAINNLAMLSIINGNYRNATELLLPQYLKGSRDSRLIHNLVFALVKSGDTDYALDIIRKERLNTSPEDLINALKKTERKPQVSR